MKKIVVDCEYNDPVDIRCGGPRILGFDFYVNDESVDNIITHIKQELHHFGRPMMNISVFNAPENAVISTKAMISECIKDGY